MLIQQKEFKAALGLVMPGVDSSASLIHAADCVGFGVNYVHSFNGVISVSAKFSAGVSGNVRANELLKIISKLPDGELNITDDDSKIYIKTGKVSVKLNKIKEGIDENILDLGINNLVWHDLPADFDSAVKLCQLANNKTTHRGLFITKTAMYNTDAKRLNQYQFSTDFPDQIWIDDPAANELQKISGLNQVAIAPDWVHFKSENEAVFSCRLKELTAYPLKQIQSIIDDNKDILTEYVMPKELSQILDRCQVLSESFDGQPSVTINITGTQLQFEASNNVGTITEVIDLEKELPAVKFKTIIPFLKEIMSKTASFGLNEKNYFIFKSDSFTQVIATNQVENAV